MDIDTYQEWTETTAVYPDKHEIAYLALGLAGESGEVAGKVKKVLRDYEGRLTVEMMDAIGDELGDVLWYLVRLADVTGNTASSLIERNVQKLTDRKTRGVIRGSGDHR